MNAQEHDRTEQATPFRREEARKHGDVQRSSDVNTFTIVFALTVFLLGSGATMWDRVATVCRQLFEAAGTTDVTSLLLVVGRAVLSAVIPLGLLVIALVILVGLAQTGPVFTFRTLEPRFERLNPVSGLRRLFSYRVLFELIKSLVKLAILGPVMYFFLLGSWPNLAVLGGQPPPQQLGSLASQGATLLLRIVAALLLIGLLDWAYTRWQYSRQLMMSRRDVKEEAKRREGDPHIRARIRELQRENLKQSRSLGNIPDADVLITNPDHVGVALRYVRTEMTAPQVVAKGTGLWLDRMKDLARQHSVPIRRQPPLARHLFRHGALEMPIPADTYLEVAHLYADLAAERRTATGRYEVTTP
jgi:flagellar biosynthetic protein FlhB